MKRITYIYSSILLGLFGLGMSSCNDFLTLYPLDKVVEENFWEDKNDLEGVRYGAYLQMTNTLEKFIAWGDIRSDAYTYNEENPNTSDYREIMLANPDSTMGCYDWGGVYTTINYCNKVLSNGAAVQEKDPQFTATEWQQMKAEMVGLRALNYFYLLRAFKDIPFTFDVISSDEDVRDFTNTSQMDVLNALIDDVKAVAGQGKSRFPADRDTKGLMTNTAIYALLADMYLWRSALREGRLNVKTGDPVYTEEDVKADAENVIFYGQKSLDALALQNEQVINSSFDRGTNNRAPFGSTLENANLIKNEDMQEGYTSNSASIDVTSFRSIFRNGNSEESMLEIQFSSSDQRKSNFLRDLWGYNANKKFPLCVSDEAVKEALNGNTTLFNEDCRTWYSCTSGNYMYYQLPLSGKSESKYYYLTKWMHDYFDKSTATGTLYVNIMSDHAQDSYHNWIIYRMTDVMLMMAEAYAITGNYAKCRNIVDAVHKRSMLDQKTGLSANSDNNKAKCINLVMRERLVEFLGEGKRWFDLVRYAERIGGGTKADPREPQFYNGSDGVRDMVETFMAKGAYSKLKENIISRIQNRYGLYSPIYYRERSANHYLLPQNPVWNREQGENLNGGQNNNDE